MVVRKSDSKSDSKSVTKSDSKSSKKPPANSKPYHHGHLAEALVDAGFQLASEGGPTNVTVREAARRVGVSAPAAYRHFADRDDFVQVVASRCRQHLALAMITSRDHHRIPLLRFKAVGRGYIEFALENPHLIDCAFVEAHSDEHALPESLATEEPNAFMVLVEALDDLVAADLLTPHRRDGAEIVAWAGVHGISMLLARSPAMRETADPMIERVLVGIQDSLGLNPKRL